MIKGISFLRPAGSAAAYERLAGFFAALGFEPGKGWQEEGSRGASFLAPLGNLEFVDGRFPSTADVLVEVTSLDSIHQVAEAWLRAHAVPGQAGDAAVSRLSPISETHWRSRIFTVEPEPGHRFSFWAWSDPVKGRARGPRGRSVCRGHEVRHRRLALERRRHRSPSRRRSRRAAARGADRSDIEVVRVPGAWEIPAAARACANPAAPTPSSLWVACCAAKPRTTRPSTTRSRAASASRSRRPAFPTASACSPAKPWSRRSTAPASRAATRALKPPRRPSRW